VAVALADHLGLSVAKVRVAFAVLAGLNGLGVLLYVVFWAVLPLSPEDGRRESRRDLAQLLPYLGIAVGVLLLERALRAPELLGGAGGWLVAIIAIGAAVIWHQSQPHRRWHWAATGVPWLGRWLEANPRTAFILRFVGGGLLVALGIVGVVAVYSPVQGLSFVVNGVLFALVGLAGVGLVAAPVLWRSITALRAEREARIREQERAELAAMVHDQVLHTLALIQRNAADSAMVQRLARGQERSLRNWLYKPTASANERLSAALEEAAAEIEDTFAITVETVVVGDQETDERVRALVAAAREALVNAARHAGVQTVSLYAEVEPEQISVFVRDRGAGFDLAGVEEHRHGVRGSIIGRMDRHGGRAEIRSAPGEGTEVRLTLPLARDNGNGNGEREQS